MHTLQPSIRNDAHARAADERHLRLDAMFREHAPRILDYARHRGATLVEAEDVVSEVFIVLTRRLDDAPAEVLPWLYGVARKVLGNQLRSKRRRLALNQRSEERAMSAGPADAQAYSMTARDVLIRKGLSMLPEKDREALLLVAWDGLRYEEAARSLGCTRTAFAQRLCRARRRLLALIDDSRTYEETDWSIIESEDA
jgi:RNA polymerase sigma-70 factor, ECF subfamily